MSIIIRLQNLPWSANSLDIRRFFIGLSIPEGGVHIVGGEMGDAFIAFSTDEDARLAMEKDGGKIKDMQIKLLLSSRTEMMRVIEQARQQNMVASQPHIVNPPPILSLQQPTRIMTPISEPERKRGHTPSPHRHSRDRSPVRDRRHSPDDRHAPKRDRSRSPSRSSRNFNRDMDRRNDRFRRDDRHYDDSHYSDERHSERETIQESKRYPDADHVNSKSQLHATEGFRNLTPSYEHGNAGISGMFPYGNQHTAVKGFQESYAHAPTIVSDNLPPFEQIPSRKPQDFPPVENQKCPYPQDSLSYRGSTFESSAKDISLSSVEQSKSRRRTRFEPEFAPSSVSSHFPTDDPKSSLQNQQEIPYHDARNLPENFPGSYSDRNTWPPETNRSSNKPWNGKQENLMNPAMSKDKDFLQAVAMDVDQLPSDISAKEKYHEALPHRGHQGPILSNMLIRNDDLRRDNQNRGLPFDKGHPIQDRTPILCDENRKTPIKDRESVMHSEKGGLSLPDRGPLSHGDNRALLHQERKPLSYGENRAFQRQDRGPMSRDEGRAHLMQDRGPMSRGENRVQDRGPIIRDENRAFLMQGREPILRGETRDRGAMSGGETREHLIMQDRGTMLHGENRDHLMQNRGTIPRGENREHLIQDRGAISRGENREHLIQDRGTMLQGENRGHLMQNRATMPHGENREHLIPGRAPMSHGENREHLIPGRTPMSHGENREHLVPARTPMPHGENREHLMQDKGTVSHGENREHLIPDRVTISHGENRDQLIQERETITRNETRTHPMDDKGQMSHGDRRQLSRNENKSTSLQDRGPKLQGENKGSPIKDKGVLPHSDGHSQPLHNDSPGQIPPSLTVEVRGLPPDARIDDILDIFRGITLPAANIRIEANNLGLEKAFIRFVSVADFEEALRRNRQLINEGRCELIPCPAAAFDNVPNFQKPRSKMKPCDEDLVVQLRGLPFSCKEDDVVCFFDGLGILDLFIEIAPDGRAAGTGFVEFGKNEDFRIALDMNGKMIGHRYITVSIASKEMMNFFRNQASKNEPPGPHHVPHFPNSGHPSNPPANETRPAPNHIRPPGPQINQGRQNTSTVQSRPPPCISMKGLPESVTNRDIVDFFAQVNVMPRAIHIMLRPDKTPSGEAFAELGSPSDLDAAIQLDANIMKGCCVLIQPISFHEVSEILGRPSLMPQPSASAPLLRTPGDGERPRRPHPIDVERPHRPFPGDAERPRRPLLPQAPNEGAFRERSRMEQPGRPFGPPRMRAPWSGRPNRPDSRFPPPERGLKDFGAPGCIVSIKNLHFKAGLEELLDFFRDYRITKDSIRRKYNENGQTTGEARIAFPNPRDAQRVVRELNQKPIMGRSLNLSVL